MAFNWWVANKTGVVMEWNGIQQRKKVNADKRKGMDEYQQYYAKWKEVDSKGNIYVCFFYMTLQETKGNRMKALLAAESTETCRARITSACVVQSRRTVCQKGEFHSVQTNFQYFKTIFL